MPLAIWSAYATARRGGQRALLEAGAQRLAVDELGDDERGVAVLRELEDGEDVRMRELRDAHRLALEPRERAGIRRELRGEDLDGDVAIEPRIARAIDLAHAARADGGDDLVVPEAGAGVSAIAQPFYVTDCGLAVTLATPWSRRPPGVAAAFASLGMDAVVKGRPDEGLRTGVMPTARQP